jgi:hypothetical protein
MPAGVRYNTSRKTGKKTNRKPADWKYTVRSLD